MLTRDCDLMAAATGQSRREDMCVPRARGLGVQSESTLGLCSPAPREQETEAGGEGLARRAEQGQPWARTPAPDFIPHPHCSGRGIRPPGSVDPLPTTGTQNPEWHRD